MDIAADVKRELSARYAQGRPSPKELRAGVRPGCRGNVTLDIYEVTEPEQVKIVAAYAREVQASVPGTSTVSLRFFEREVWIPLEGGGGYRGREKLLKTIILPVQQSGRVVKPKD